MLWGFIIAAFWVSAIITLFWIVSKPRLRKKYGFFSILFTSFIIGVIVAMLVFFAYIALIFFFIFLAILIITYIFGLFFKGKKRSVRRIKVK